MLVFPGESLPEQKPPVSKSYCACELLVIIFVVLVMRLLLGHMLSTIQTRNVL